MVATFSEGDLLTEQGDFGTRLFVVLAGNCDVFQQPPPPPQTQTQTQTQTSGAGGAAGGAGEERAPWGVPVTRLGPGTYFG